MKHPALLVLALALPLAAGFIGSLATSPAIPTWYATLEKPVFSPPNWLFAPVWTTLYLLMGIALYRIWRLLFEQTTHSDQRLQARYAVKLFFAQLGLNAIWSLLFFGLRNPLLGLIDIVVLLIVLSMTVRAFARLDRTAAWLLSPYLLWVTFATALNTAIWYLN